MADTYKEIARLHGLTGNTANRYIKYMKTRWASTEEVKSKTGYAGEWAERFKSGYEYSYSDEKGRAVLRDMKEY